MAVHTIESYAETVKEYEGLVSIKGIGPRSVAIFLSAISDAGDFKTEDRLAAYFAVLPRVSQSDETDHQGRITRRGNRLVRTTLVQCVFITIRHLGYLNSFYRRIKERGGTGKAIIATASRLLRIIFNTLKNSWVFKDFTASTLVKNNFAAGQSSQELYSCRDNLSFPRTRSPISLYARVSSSEE